MICTLLHVLLFFSANVIIPDTTIVDNNITFKGQIITIEEDTLCKGILIDNKFNKAIGFWDVEGDNLHVLFTNGYNSSESYYDNIGYDNEKGKKARHFYEYLKIGSRPKENKWIETIDEGNEAIWNKKTYHPEKGRWMIRRSRSHSDYERGIYYTKTQLHDVSWHWDHRLFIGYFGSFFVLFCGLLMLFKPITGDYKLLLPLKVSIIIGSIIMIVYYFLNSFLRRQILTPIWICACPFLLCELLKNRKLKRIVQFLICLVFLIGGECYQFLYLNEKTFLGDQSQIELHWRVGAGLVKRYYIKKMVNNMIPVVVNKGTPNEYVIYMNKYEFSEGDREVIIDEYTLFNIKRPAKDLSFREAQILSEKLSELTGLNFGLPRVEEYQSAIKGEESYETAEMGDEIKVRKGEPNENGFVFLTSNVAEYTYSYSNNKKRLNIDGDSLVQSFDFVFVSGLAENYGSKDLCYSMTNEHLLTMYDIVNKNDGGAGNIGFRIVYRPNDIGKREFVIKGKLRNEKKTSGFPEEILLLSLNGNAVSNMANYETFQERLIESRFREKEIKAIDLSSDKTVQLNMPVGYEYYDFIPEFSFKDVGKAHFLLLPPDEFEKRLKAGIEYLEQFEKSKDSTDANKDNINDSIDDL